MLNSYAESLRKIDTISEDITGGSLVSIMYYIAELCSIIRNRKYRSQSEGKEFTTSLYTSAGNIIENYH